MFFTAPRSRATAFGLVLLSACGEQAGNHARGRPAQARWSPDSAWRPPVTTARDSAAADSAFRRRAAFGRGPVTRDEAIFEAGATYNHGMPGDVIERLTRDSATVALYAEMLAGRVPWPRPPEFADTAQVLMLLAGPSRRADVPLFLRFTDAAASGQPGAAYLTTYRNAVYALTRHLDEPAVRRRLSALGSAPDRPTRWVVINTLARSTDTAGSRRVLRTISPEMLRPDSLVPYPEVRAAVAARLRPPA
jgi:hypothetical protein